MGHNAKPNERVMAKGCWIVSVDISNPESHKMYVAETRSAFRKYGARFVVRGGKSEVAEGKGRSRIVVIEFKDYATALECYRSPEYSKAIEIRKGSAVADIIIVDGYHGRAANGRINATSLCPHFDGSLASAFFTSDWEIRNCRAIRDGVKPALKAARIAFSFP